MGPSTWDTPYAGKQDEQAGIVAILGMIKEDIEKDKTAAKAEENAAAKAYSTFKTESQALITEEENSITGIEAAVGSKRRDIKDNSENRATAKGELDAALAKNREIEMDGLKEAKTFLSQSASE